MKRYLLLCAALLLFCGGAYAQSAAKDRLSEIEEMTVPEKNKAVKLPDSFSEFSLLSHYGFGMHNVSGSPAFRDRFGRSRERFVNLCQVSLRPTGWLYFDLGVDFRADAYEALPGKEFSFADKSLTVSDRDDLSSLRSYFSTGSFSIPLAVHLHSDYVGFRAGAELFRPLRKMTVRSSYAIGDTHYSTWTRGTSIRGMGYDLFAALLVGDMVGVYYRYYPGYKVTGGNFSFGYSTLGVIFSFE